MRKLCPVLVMFVLCSLVAMSACSKTVAVKETRPSEVAAISKPVTAPELDAKAYYELGLRAANHNDAIEAFTKALKLDPAFADAYLGRGDAYSVLKRATKAVWDYTQYLELKPGDMSVYRKRAEAYTHTGEFKRCIKDLDKVVAESPKDGDVYFLRGVCYEMSDNKDQAIQDYMSAAMLGHDPARAELKSRGIQW